MTDKENIFTRLFVKKSSHSFIEFFRYFFVAVSALATDFMVLFVLTHFFHVHYLVSAVVSYLSGMVVNYFLSIVWVFRTRRFNDRRKELFIFFTIGIIGLGVNEFLMWLFTDVLLLYYMISRIISAGVGYVWKYIARKLILFK